MKQILITLILLMPFISLGQTSCDCGQETFYSWSENGSTQTVTIDPSCPSDSDTYVVTVTDGCGNTATDSEVISICSASQISINTAFYNGSAQMCLLFPNTLSCCYLPQYEWVDPCGSVVSAGALLGAADITVCGIYTLNLLSCNGCTECSSSATINIQNGSSNAPDCCGGVCGCVSCPANIVSYSGIVPCNQAANYSGTICTGASLTWSATLGGSTVATGSGQNFTFTPATDGAYTITLTVLDGCGITTTSTVTTTVNSCGSGCQDCSSATISASNTPSCNVATTFTIPCSNTSTFNWSITGGGGSVNGNQLTYTPTSTGTYTVSVTFVDQCNNTVTDFYTFSVNCVSCSDCTSEQITANNTPSCDNSTTFNINCFNANVSWSITGGGGFSSGNNFTYTPTSSGSYTVTATVADDCNNQFVRTFNFSVTCTSCDCVISLVYDDVNCEMDYTVTGCDSWQLRKGINAACNGVVPALDGIGSASGSYDICNGLGDGFYNLIGVESGCPFQQSACLESSCCVVCEPVTDIVWISGLTNETVTCSTADVQLLLTVNSSVIFQANQDVDSWSIVNINGNVSIISSTINTVTISVSSTSVLYGCSGLFFPWRFNITATACGVDYTEEVVIRQVF